MYLKLYRLRPGEIIQTFDVKTSTGQLATGKIVLYFKIAVSCMLHLLAILYKFNIE